jgi:hypothetical protein
MTSQCQIPTQEFLNGFCYDKCPAGYSPYNSGICLQNCPINFTDLGTACQPPSVLRTSAKTMISKCADNQVDRNGNCYEPQMVNTILLNGVEVPKVTGCGCIRKTFAQRIQCPSGFDIYNNECVSKCPTGFTGIKDINGNISSMYCIAECPLRIGTSNQRWKFVGGLCVKDFTRRLAHSSSGLSSTPGTFIETPVDGIPNTMVSYLAGRPLGSSLNDRNRVGQSINESLGATQPFSNPFASSIGDSWLSLIFDPAKLAYALIIFGVIIFGGPTLFPLLAGGIGALFKGIGLGLGSTAEGAGSLAKSVESGTGKLVESVEVGTGKVAEATLGTVAAGIDASAASVRARNVAKPINAQRDAIDQLTTAQENLNRATAAAIAAGVPPVPGQVGQQVVLTE